MASTIPKTRIRQATSKDLDALTDLFLTCIAVDRVMQNRYRFREEFPDDHVKFTRLYMELILSGEYPDFLTWVLEVEEGGEGGDVGMEEEKEKGKGGEDGIEEVRWKVAAMAIWDVAYVNKRAFKERGETYIAPSPNTAMEEAGSSSRRDKDPIYEAEFRKFAMEAKNEFEKLLGDEDMYLSMLATYPWARRRGYATALVRWGTERSERDGVHVSLISSLMGEGLYRECGFVEMGRSEVVIGGGEEGNDEGDGKGEQRHKYEREVLVRMVYRPRSLGE